MIPGNISDLDKQIFISINKLRKKPKHFVEKLKNMLKRQSGNILMGEGDQKDAVTVEGKVGLMEAINELIKVKSYK